MGDVNDDMASSFIHFTGVQSPLTFSNNLAVWFVCVYIIAGWGELVKIGGFSSDQSQVSLKKWIF